MSFAARISEIIGRYRGDGSIQINAFALWADAIEAIQKYGTMVKSPNGYPVQSPYIAIANRQAEIMLRIAFEFGFSPASRSRIATSSPAEPSCPI
jgi:P27 family predicted phage terminase small subunit